MTTTTWPDPARRGVPLNPEQDGWHWMKARSDNLKATWREKFPAQWTAGNRHWIHGTYAPEYAAENWIYLCPIATPEETAAKDARIAELEGALAALQRDASQETSADDLVKRLQHLGDWQAADRIEALQKRVAELRRLVKILVENDPDDMAADAVTVLDVWRGEARAALGGKDE